MTLRIIKPPKPGKMFVTLASTGYLFFSSRAVAELNLSEHKGVLLAHDERGALHLKVSYNTDPDAFRVYVRKNGACSVTCIRVAPYMKRSNKMKHISIALIYVAFFALIGFALWITKSVWVLLALLFIPDYKETE